MEDGTKFILDQQQVLIYNKIGKNIDKISVTDISESVPFYLRGIDFTKQMEDLLNDCSIMANVNDGLRVNEVIKKILNYEDNSRDNQFFGVNHFDLNKGEKTKLKFDSLKKIKDFINDSLSFGLDGFMINSNDKGYKLISQTDFEVNKEIHYSIPYPHKYANMINESGMISLLKYVIKNTSFEKYFG